MQLNFNAILKDFDGNTLKENGNELSLKTVSVNALMFPYPDESNLSGDEKMNRYLLAQRLHAGGEIELRVEEVAKLKALIGKAYGPVIVGPSFQILEGARTEIA
jgi:hypothetical protein